MILYLIKSAICLTLLYGFYYTFLEQKKMHHFNRFYLVGIILFSVIIPKINLYLESSLINPMSILSDSSMTKFQWNEYLITVIGIYSIGVILILLRFVRNLVRIFKTIVENPHIKLYDANIVLIKEQIIPHTFLNYIFINKEDYYTKVVDTELLTHEFAHVNDKHSYDILLIELFHCVFWFNPIIIYIKKSIRLNHEFIADDNVIKLHKDPIGYQNKLLELALWDNGNILTSNLNFMVAKKRFEMMAKKSGRKSMLIAKTTIISLLVSFVFLFGNIMERQETENDEHVKEKTEANFEKGHHDQKSKAYELSESSEHTNESIENHK